MTERGEKYKLTPSRPMSERTLRRPAKEHPLKPCIAADCDGEMIRTDDVRFVGHTEVVYPPGTGPLRLCTTCGELEWVDPEAEP